MNKPSAFTLIELVIVIAILAILAAVAVLVINPAEQIKITRDSTRMSDFASIKSSIGLYMADGRSSMGSSNIVYVSIPSANSNCSDLGLPTLPGGWSYQCSNSTNYRKVDSTGWIPIDFTQISFGNVLQTLPIDPVNTTSTGNYYTYVTGGSYQLSTLFESSKYNSTLTSQYYTVGTNSNLLPTLALVASSTNVTMNLSLVNGTAFITSSSLNLSPYLNKYIIISDGTNNIQGFIKTQGTGETLGGDVFPNNTAVSDTATESNTISSWLAQGSPTTFESISTDKNIGSYSFHIVASGTDQGFAKTIGGLTAGMLYKHGIDLKKISGGNIDYQIWTNTVSKCLLDLVVAPNSWTSYFNYRTTEVSGFFVRALTTVSSGEFYADNIYMRQVLAPSASGVTITNTRGGSTYNWVSNTGINPNAASFTVTVSP